MQVLFDITHVNSEHNKKFTVSFKAISSLLKERLIGKSSPKQFS